jgi:tripartite-type tricarboxylate transporter receptor subunit TctC
MKLPRRELCIWLRALPFAPHAARAQAYPRRPVHIVNGFAAGGSADIAARIMAQWLSQRLAQQFIVNFRALRRAGEFSVANCIEPGSHWC